MACYMPHVTKVISNLLIFFQSKVKQDLNGDKNYFYPCLKDLVQFINGYNPDDQEAMINEKYETFDEFFQDSNNVLLVLSDMNFESIKDLTKNGKFAHCMQNDIENFLYSDMTMEQVCGYFEFVSSLFQEIKNVFGRPNVIGIKIDNQSREDFEKKLADPNDPELRQRMKVAFGDNAQDAIISVTYQQINLLSLKFNQLQVSDLEKTGFKTIEEDLLVRVPAMMGCIANGASEKVKRGWRALKKTRDYRNDMEIQGINFINTLIKTFCGLLIALVLLLIIIYASKPFGDTQAEIDRKSLLNLKYPVQRHQPDHGRTALECSEIGNLCAPCGVTCDQMFCSSNVCSLACLDENYENRTGTFYTELSDDDSDHVVDFNRCHDTWQSHSLNLKPTSTDNSLAYTVVGGLAAILNVTVLASGIYHVYKWSVDYDGNNWEAEPGSKPTTVTTRNRNLYGDRTSKKSIWSYKKLASILSTLMSQIADSLLDALYFVKLKSKARLIHVPFHIQAFQGVMLYTCKLYTC